MCRVHGDPSPGEQRSTHDFGAEILEKNSYRSAGRCASGASVGSLLVAVATAHENKFRLWGQSHVPDGGRIDRTQGRVPIRAGGTMGIPHSGISVIACTAVLVARGPPRDVGQAGRGSLGHIRGGSCDVVG